ncbi:peptide/nickel transport system permease protein [Parafrankia irregularis]|uniref:Peptide/nickel transport system permease protein n=1 Tax=Parafrankia irregularis TaxID=795642 RepID=A0A0S4QRV2_9ACTN|nr:MULTISPECIES: ABC transporter permease [Parafrankia]MBE3205843.1 ABC transporter permease [Parafrankia sp. CH37]CUU58211.1 peptide/nickel transport system permease protein [Parafrankia irregularis]
MTNIDTRTDIDAGTGSSPETGGSPETGSSPGAGIDTVLTGGARRPGPRGWSVPRPGVVSVPRPGVVVAAAVLALAAFVAAAPGLLTDAAPTDIDPVHALAGPGAGHWFGTDQLGRDVFTRVVYGARTSLLLGLAAIGLAVAGGVVLGLATALGGRGMKRILTWLTDVTLALPPVLLALLVVAVLGAGTANTVIAIAIALIPVYGRLVRTEAMLVLRSGYVEAAVGLGLRRGVVVARHVLPNALGPVLVLATVGFGTALMYASALSFLGLGSSPPSPEWGLMLSEGRDFLQTAWWTGVFPGAAITGTVIAVTVVGRYAQARFAGRVDWRAGR